MLTISEQVKNNRYPRFRVPSDQLLFYPSFQIEVQNFAQVRFYYEHHLGCFALLNWDFFEIIIIDGEQDLFEVVGDEDIFDGSNAKAPTESGEELEEELLLFLGELSCWNTCDHRISIRVRGHYWSYGYLQVLGNIGISDVIFHQEQSSLYVAPSCDLCGAT